MPFSVPLSPSLPPLSSSLLHSVVFHLISFSHSYLSVSHSLSLTHNHSFFLSPPKKNNPKTHSVLMSSFRRSFFNGNIFQMGKTHSALKYPRGLWAPLCSLNLLMLSSHIQICMMPYSTGCEKACIWLNKYVHWLKGLVWHHRASAFSVMLMKWRLNYKSAWYKIS